MTEGPPGTQLAEDTVSRIAIGVDSRNEELIAFRRRLHAEPELSFKEVATTDALAERLQLAGLIPQILDSGTGLVCEIGSGGPVVALRADIDALAMPDAKTDVTYRSRNEGVAHACGHDVHTAVVLGAGLVLQDLAEVGQLPGRVRLVFEPGEESVPGGAVEVVESGWLNDVAAVYALHCDPKKDVGRVGSRVGPITSASDWLEITLRGPGGHTARPHLTVDLVTVVAHVITTLPSLLSDRLGGHDACRLVFGAVHAGAAANVIPSSAFLTGSVRSRDRQTWERVRGELDAALADALAGSSAQCEVNYVQGVPPVVNDAQAMHTMATAARQLVGTQAVGETEHSWGGDSFGWMTNAAPGAYLRLGTHDPADAERLDLHNSHFDVDERCIAIGAKTLAATAVLGLLAENGRGGRAPERTGGWAGLAEA